VAGPTGSGKTTTLYSALKAIQKKEEKIITIEDPVEYQLADIVQVPVNEKKGLTFARGLRSIVRQDPDIIMIGEIRDLDTAQIAINAALTGHLVLTTIHSNNVIDALTRLVNIGVEEYQFASSFNMIMAQRLLRKVCNACKIEEISAHSSFKGETIWRGKGCRFCNESGFYGRTAIFEMLELEDDIRELILEKKNPIQIKRLAIEKGVKFLRDAAIEKVRAGLTTPEEIDRVTYDERR
jgi:type IV pilus assembly protein PilB